MILLQDNSIVPATGMYVVIKDICANAIWDYSASSVDDKYETLRRVIANMVCVIRKRRSDPNIMVCPNWIYRLMCTYTGQEVKTLRSEAMVGLLLVEPCSKDGGCGIGSCTEQAHNFEHIRLKVFMSAYCPKNEVLFGHGQWGSSIERKLHDVGRMVICH